MPEQLVQRYLDELVAEYASVDDGALADYIPELTEVDPTGFGLTLSSSDGFLYESGNARTEFTIQSISKPFTYALALDQVGQEAVDAKIGVEPSGDAFNEISVDEHTKTPKNPMINAGAIAAVSLIPGASPDERFAKLQDFYSGCAGRPLELDEDVYRSEKATGNRNREWLRRVHDVGGVHAVMHGGYAASAVDRGVKLPRLVEFTSTLRVEAAELGIELMLENLIPDKLGYSHIMASNLAEWTQLVAEIGCGAVLDTSHSAASGIALGDVFEALGPSVRAIHLSDNDGVSDLHLLPGDGNDVTAGLAALLSGIGYDGVITYEISPLRYSLGDVLAHIMAEAAR